MVTSILTLASFVKVFQSGFWVHQGGTGFYGSSSSMIVGMSDFVFDDPGVEADAKLGVIQFDRTSCS